MVYIIINIIDLFSLLFPISLFVIFKIRDISQIDVIELSEKCFFLPQ